ncbi:alpha/beta fold hydrolase [Virgisporangium aurantiacum]|uniref:Aminopeptidase n=1 Tax=Virgisporangium aurantiacum TaxID=175570 RepID=A0A8J4E4R9_9ACTN|nr:alpha/beta fold hydrolase [Virgisporangium aurantiacum]GIJ61389.1 aminopeptidase [Virgisporangium aurantiacum]
MMVYTQGLVLIEHEFDVPLDHADPDGPTITVFAREVADPAGRDRPFLVYLQGGPGYEAPRPTRHPSSPGWLDRALSRHRVLMLDQRGTGRSTPVGDLAGTPREQAEYLAHFRADSIVRDAELIRTAVGVDRWSILGQSFGGFCALTYLSLAPHSLAAAYITGGVPPLDRSPDEIYAATFDRMLDLNRRYYDRYPADRDRVRNLKLDGTLANGDPLTARRLRCAGNHLGMDGGAEQLHYLLELPPDSPAFRHDLQQVLPFARNPLYAVIHEACYANGTATRWAADRVMPQEFHDDPTLFTGEHLFPWMLDEYTALNQLKEAANLLAEREWPHLYDPDVLRRNEVRVAATVYADDPFVPAGFSMETVGRVRGMRAWFTNEYLHNGLRSDGDRVLGRLMDLADGR